MKKEEYFMAMGGLCTTFGLGIVCAGQANGMMFVYGGLAFAFFGYPILSRAGLILKELGSAI